MVRKPKKAVPRRLKRNPVARSLASPLFRERKVERPDRPKRKPKHPKRPDEDEAGE